MNRERPLQIQSVILLACLALQYVLGMYANLFVHFPDGATGGAAWAFAWKQTWLAAHISLGILLAVGSVVFMIRVLRHRDRIWRSPAIWGFVGVWGAATSGAEFVRSQSDFYSYFMSLFFLLAFFAYAWGLVASRKETKFIP